MANNIVTVDILKSEIVSSRNKNIYGKYVRSVDVNQTNGYFLNVEPLNMMGVITEYPSNPNNGLYEIKSISKISNTSVLNFPLDAKYNIVANNIVIADAGNMRVVTVSKNNYSLISEVKNIVLPHVVIPNINSGGVFVKAFDNIRTGVIYDINRDGVISNTFKFDYLFSYNSLNIVREDYWLDSLPLVSSMCHDYVRDRLWWVSESICYMSDMTTKCVVSFDLSSYNIYNIKSIIIDISSGSAYLSVLSNNLDSYIVKVNRDNNKFLGEGWVDNPEHVSTSSSSSSLSTLMMSSSSSSSSSTWLGSSYSSSSTSSISMSSNSSSSIVYPKHGALWVWGGNISGQLGLGNLTLYSSPVRVPGYSNWNTLSNMNETFKAVKTDGTLWSWGDNQYGKLGLGDMVNRSSPVQVGILSDWKYISGNAAIKTDGTLWTWGGNSVGVLGLGDLINRSSPMQVGTENNWKYIYGNYSCCFAIKTDGTLWSWGSNVNGQLGLGDMFNRSSPTQIGTLSDWKYISNSYAVKVDGTLWSWGYNGNGELGLGDKDNRSSPTQIGTYNLWNEIYSGGNFRLAIRTDGTLWAMGWNIYGQLGLGNIIDKSSPVQIGSDSNWSNVSGGYLCSYAMKSNGTLWSWGYNANGVLGLGDKNNRSLPTQIGMLSTWRQVGEGFAIK